MSTPEDEQSEAAFEEWLEARHVCSDCGTDIDTMSLHEHLLIHRKLGI